MRLNYDCMRKVLSVLEECLTLDENLEPAKMTVTTIVNIPALSNEFSKQDIAYSVYMLSDADLIVHEFPYYKGTNAVCKYSENCVISLTYKGHEFLQKIQNDTVWNKTKEKLKSLGVMTVEIISQVASNIIAQSLNIKE